MELTSSDCRVADGAFELRHLNNVIRANATDRGLPVRRVEPRRHQNHVEGLGGDHLLRDLVLCQAILAVFWVGVGWYGARAFRVGVPSRSGADRLSATRLPHAPR